MSRTVNTSFVERQHGTDRHRNARKSRKTYRFSKDWRVHEAMTYFTLYSYNFCWPVRTLRQRDERGPVAAADARDGGRAGRSRLVTARMGQLPGRSSCIGHHPTRPDSGCRRAAHQPVEETASRRQVQVPLGGRAVQADEVLPDHAWRYRRQLHPLPLDARPETASPPAGSLSACAGCDVRHRNIRPRRSAPRRLPARSTPAVIAGPQTAGTLIGDALTMSLLIARYL